MTISLETPLVLGMRLMLDENPLEFFKIQGLTRDEFDGHGAVLGRVDWSASGGYEDRLDATYLYEADNDVRAQYSIIPQ